MPLIAQMFAVIAAILHIWFVLESILWRRPTDAMATLPARVPGGGRPIAPMALNEVFYNLFLALGVLGGVLTAHPDGNFIYLGDGGSGEAIALFACLVMVGAGIVLVLGDRRFLPAGLIQAGPPALAILTMTRSQGDDPIWRIARNTQRSSHRTRHPVCDIRVWGSQFTGVCLARRPRLAVARRLGHCHSLPRRQGRSLSASGTHWNGVGTHPECAKMEHHCRPVAHSPSPYETRWSGTISWCSPV